ncbi:hypothetical protein C0416_00470 [bacterium]|nr:hypothetical protein [bacterium]
MNTKIKTILAFSQIIMMICVGNVVVYAQGVLLINTDIEQLDNTLVLDADDTGGDIKLQFGGTLDKYLEWDSASDYFSFNDDVYLQGNEIKNFRIDNLSSIPTCDGSAIGRLYHNTVNLNSYICNGTDWEQIDIPAGSAITGVDSNTFVLDQDDTGGDVVLQFGDLLNEYLVWDDSEGRFYLSDGLKVDGDLLPAVDNMYSLGSEDLRWSNIYAVGGLNIENGDVSVGEGGFVVSFNNGQEGVGNTILAGHVLQIDPTEVNAVMLTVSQNDQPIGVAVNDTAHGEIVNAILIGKGTVMCTGAVNVGELIQTSSVVGAAKAGGSSTKIIGSAVTACSGGFLDAIIHLE